MPKNTYLEESTAVLIEDGAIASNQKAIFDAMLEALGQTTKGVNEPISRNNMLEGISALEDVWIDYFRPIGAFIEEAKNEQQREIDNAAEEAERRAYGEALLFPGRHGGAK